MLAWVQQAQCEMCELVLITKETVAAAKIRMAEAERILIRDRAIAASDQREPRRSR
jgi:hypothetical protein